MTTHTATVTADPSLQERPTRRSRHDRPTRRPRPGRPTRRTPAEHLPRGTARRGGLVGRVLASAALALGVAAPLCGTAWAVWSSSGAGTGSAGTGTVVSLTTTAVAAPADGAYPGGPATALAVAVSNPNPFAVQVTSVALDPSRPVTVSGASGTCSAPPVSVSATGLSLSVPANASGTVLTVPGALTLGSSTDSGCQGATFTVPVVLTGRTS